MSLVRNLRQLTFSPKLNQSKRLRALLYLVLAVIWFVLFVGNVLPPRYNYKLNDTATTDIRAPFDAVDTLQTQRLEEQAMEKVAPVYDVDPSVLEQAIEHVNDLFQQIKNLNLDTTRSLSERVVKLQSSSPFQTSLSVDIYKELLSFTDTQDQSLSGQATQILQTMLGQPFSQTDYQNRENAVDNLLINLDLDKTARLDLRDLLLVSLKPNLIENTQKTNEAREIAKKNVQAVRINKGDLIVHKGDLITSEVLQKLKDVNLLYESPNYKVYIGFAIFTLLLVALLEGYQYFLRIKTLRENLYLLLFVIVLAVSSLVMKTVEMLYSQNAGYLVPTALGTLLATVLFDANIGFLASIVLALLAGIQFDFNFHFLFVAFISGVAGVFAVSRVKHRLVIMQAGVWIAAANLLTIACMEALLSSADIGWSVVMQGLFFGLMNGLLSAVLTIGILPFLESSFGLLTPIRLLELSDPNHPLLKKLLMEAPGSYHHSLIVGNLAEAAAETVGANPLLCRVGAYFHDVGKARRPAFFIENQLSKENPHDKIAPSLSYLILTAHVKDGLEMQEQYRLPKPIRDICEQHHGTTILQYFYNKAVTEAAEKGNTVSVDDYRYPGPKPGTKEAAIVMLCDAVEAAVRSMSKPTPNRIEALIRKIMMDRLNDGQLDECDLTLKDLDKIAHAFMRALNGIYHHRIEYPDLPKQEAKK